MAGGFGRFRTVDGEPPTRKRALSPFQGDTTIRAGHRPAPTLIGVLSFFRFLPCTEAGGSKRPAPTWVGVLSFFRFLPDAGDVPRYAKAGILGWGIVPLFQLLPGTRDMPRCAKGRSFDWGIVLKRTCHSQNSVLTKQMGVYRAPGLSVRSYSHSIVAGGLLVIS